MAPPGKHIYDVEKGHDLASALIQNQCPRLFDFSRGSQKLSLC